jgi:hypothetical protein
MVKTRAIMVFFSHNNSEISSSLSFILWSFLRGAILIWWTGLRVKKKFSWCYTYFICKVAPYLKRLVSRFQPRRPGFAPGDLAKWDLWWTKWRWGKCSPGTSVSPANLHSTKFSILTISQGRYNRPEVAHLTSGHNLDFTPKFDFLITLFIT